ncbi:hypothetical protein ASPBRDRAFT_30899 [Aspergillus brasiliensis CBS 101740]|uniref:BRCT domain-containing protein n=1 Tax=Aspergillus brasiliensis (strain CBS 101740 / IMI 381727 / IBT 21946) TaxID=767769 RepID=A0A1L9UHQ4_ASPBC|nr:hypothetical protein ASPBRDRAFT_30899 [Aspergillus brasiliensis CBS 101740]
MARAAVIPQSPPKRTTRTRTKGSTTTTSTRAAPKTTKAKAPSSATEARKRGSRTTAAASRPVEEDTDDSTDDELGMLPERKTTATAAKPKGRPTTKTTTTTTTTTGRGRKPATTTNAELGSDNDNDLAQSDAPKKRAGRPRTKPATPAKTETAPKTRGRPKGTTTAKSTRPVDPVKENTRLNAKGFTDIDFSSSQEAPKRVYIATNSATARSNMLRGPAKKKKVTFQDPSETAEEEMSEPSPPPAAGRRRGTIGPGRPAGLASKPVRKPAATSGKGRKPATAKKDAPKPLSPKKATQVAKALSSYADSDEDDELSGDKDQVKFVVDSPHKHGSENTGLSSPVKKINITGKFRKSLDENGEPLPGPRRSIDFNDTLLMSSPARRPPPSPFNFSLRETPKRGGFALRDDPKSLSQPHLSPTHNSPLKLSPRKAHLETPKRGSIFLDSGKPLSQPNFTPGHNSPLKSSPRKGLFGASFTSQAHAESTSTPLRHSVSFLQSPAKRIASPFKSSLFASRSTIAEDVQVDTTHDVAEPATPDVDESPLRMTDFERTENVESEDEQAGEELAETVDDNDTIKEIHAQSPAVAEESDEDALHEEYDREQTIEYEQEDSNNAAEEVTAHEHIDSDFHKDQHVEQPADESDEATEEPMEEFEEDFEEEIRDDPMEENVDESVKPTDEPVEEPIDEPMEEHAEDAAEETMIEPTEHIDDPVEEPMEELAEESVEPPMEETVEESVEKEAAESTEEPAERAVEEPVSEPVVETVREPEAEQTHSPGKDEEPVEKRDEHEAHGQATEHAEDGPELDADVSAPDAREDTVEMEDIYVSRPEKDLSPEKHSETCQPRVEEEASVGRDQENVEQPSHEAEEHIESAKPAVEKSRGPARTGLRSSLVEGLEDVFVEHATASDPVNDERDGSETEDDPDMLEASDEENAAAFDDFDDVDDQYTFDDSEPTLVGFEATERIPPNLIPIQPYEVEEAEDPFSPSRQAQNASRRVLSPVRILESPIRRSTRNVPTAAPAMGSGAQNGVDLSDPFVEHSQATPRRRSTRGLLFDNAPRFTPLAQQFRQWKADSPEKAQARRPRRGIFSLGGRSRRSSNVTHASEVSYPDVSRQAEASSSEPPISQQEREEVDVPEVAEVAEQEPEADIEEQIQENTTLPGSPALQEQSEDADVLQYNEDEEQEPEPVAEEPNEPSSAEVPTPQEDTDDVDMSQPEEQDEVPEPVGDEPSPEKASLPNSPILEEDRNDADMPAVYEDEEQSQPISDVPSQAEVSSVEPDSLQETDNHADVPQIYEDEDQGSQQADEADILEEPVEQPVTEEANGSKEAVADTSEDKENAYAELPSVPDSPGLASESQPGKERELGDVPVLAPSTPTKNRIPEMQTVHTVSKVPLKPEGQISPLKMSRKRGLSLSAPSPVRSSRPRMSTTAPVAQNAPQLSPRKSPRLQRAAARPSLGQSYTPETAKKPTEAQKPAPPKRPSYSPSPKKKTKAPRTSIDVPKLALQGSVVYVDVHTTEGEDASGIFIELLQQMGARCVKNWSWNPRASVSPEEGTEPKEGKVGITHVVYKDGGVRTLEKVRHARGLVKCVGVGWVLDCERENKWLDESHYEVDLSIIPRGGAKRRKSMEPRALSNVNGTLVKTDAGSASANRRRSGLAPPKQSIPRDSTPSSRDEPSTPDATPKIGAGHTEADQQYCHTPKTPGYTFDMDAIGMSPATPFYLSQRTKLVQQTCPPKQTRQGLFTTPAAAREPNQKLRAKLEAARRKSLAYKPRVGSPLVE